MAELNDDEDTFIGRRFKSLKRSRPIDLSLGYYMNTKENAPIVSEKQSLIKVEEGPFPSSLEPSPAANPTDDNTPVGRKKQANITTFSPSNAPIPQALESSDQVTVDHFLKATSRPTTRNYKQARKQKQTKRFVQSDDPPDDHLDAPANDQPALTPKPRKTANNRSRTQRRVRLANSLLVPGVKLRSVLASPPVLHFRWKPVQNGNTRAVHGSSKLNQAEGGTADSRSNRTVPPRVGFLPFGWKDQNRQQANRPTVRAVRKRRSIAIVPVAPRTTLTFETIEEHDKKLDVWFGKSSRRARGVTNSKAPGVRGIPPLPLSDDASPQLNNKLRPLSNAKDLSHNAVQKSSRLPLSVGIAAQRNTGRTNEKNAKQIGTQATAEELVTGQKLTHLGDMLGDLRLSAKEFYHASGNGPSAG